MEDPPETTEFLTFVRTVEARSISRAAREMGVPRPTVGRRLARLEEKLGVRLLRRTTRAMTLTDAGEALYVRARGVIAAVRDAESSVRQRDGAVRGSLRVSTPAIDFDGFYAMVAAFAARYPDVRLELDVTARHVDFSAGGHDVAIRASERLPPGLIARNLLRTHTVVVASPAYLARRGTPRRVTDLAQHACLVGFALGEHAATHWPLVRGGSVRVEATMATNDPRALREAALAGNGLALLPLTFVYDDIAAGALTPVLPQRVGGDNQIAVVYPEREFVPPAVRAFVEAVVAWAKTAPQLNRKFPDCEAKQKAKAMGKGKGTTKAARPRG